MDPDPNLEIVYVADPMCSWCWGFAPTIDKVDASYDIPLRIVVGGLRPGNRAEPLDAIRGLLQHHWGKVATASGQPFDLAGLEREDWVYDTMTADTAVVTMRHLAPDETLAFFTRVQRAFYAERVDVTDPDVYPALLEGFPVDVDEFASNLASPGMKAATEKDFEEAAWLGVTGFPTLLLRDGASTVPLSLGYAPFERVAERLNGLIERNHPEAAEGLVCDIDGEAC